MMKRYEKIVLQKESTLNFEISEGLCREYVISILNDNSNLEKNHLTQTKKNYENPPVPEGWTHVCGEWYYGFVIERNSDKSRFTWIPVGYLDFDGTLNGIIKNSQFGRRDFMEPNEPLSPEYFDEFTDEFISQIESVTKYGGFYISSYLISLNKETGKMQSVKDAYPIIDYGFKIAECRIPKLFPDSDCISCHLPFGAEYDSVVAFLQKTSCLSYRNNFMLGYYEDRELVQTFDDEGNEIGSFPKIGSNEQWCINNIYDFVGYYREITQEYYKDKQNVVVRGGCYLDQYGPTVRKKLYVYGGGFREAFRISLCLK